MAEHQFKGRREDLRLVTGRGSYTTDNNVDGQAAAHFLRADRAHARIVKVDIESARKLPGVLDIVTGTDIAATGWKTPPVLSFFKGVGGSSLRVPFRGGLAHDRVRFVGEPVALVVAETEHQAQDAAELIEIEYEDLPVIVEAADGDRGRRRQRCTTTRPAIWRWTTSMATAPPPSRASPTPSTSCASSCTRSGSPAIRWSRSRASRATTPRTSSSSSACRPRAPAT